MSLLGAQFGKEAHEASLLCRVRVALHADAAVEAEVVDLHPLMDFSLSIELM